jgi:hypothetical protein
MLAEATIRTSVSSISAIWTGSSWRVTFPLVSLPVRDMKETEFEEKRHHGVGSYLPKCGWTGDWVAGLSCSSLAGIRRRQWPPRW